MKKQDLNPVMRERTGRLRGTSSISTKIILFPSCLDRQFVDELVGLWDLSWKIRIKEDDET